MKPVARATTSLLAMLVAILSIQPFGCKAPGVATPTPVTASGREGGAAIAAIHVEPARFRNGADVLAGDFYRPAGPGRYPAVALILGSGREDRRYGGMATALCRFFARHGIASLTWDKPGVGESTGDFNRQTLPERAKEAEAAVAYLARRPDVRPDRVGVWGHSQGGIVAPLAAAEAPAIAFLIEVSGWQGPAWQQDAVRVEAELREEGFGAAEIDEALGFTNGRMALLRAGGEFEELDRRQRLVADKRWFPHVHWCDRALFASSRMNVNYDSSGWWERVRCPVLAVYGTADTSSGRPGALLQVIDRGLARGGNRDFTAVVYPNADHLIQCRPATAPATAGAVRAPESADDGGGRFVEGYPQLMADWIAGRSIDTGAPPPRPAGPGR